MCAVFEPHKRIPCKYVAKPDGNCLVLSFFEPDRIKWQEMLGYVKAFKGCSWDAREKRWRVPDTENNRDMLIAVGYNISSEKHKPKEEVKVDRPVRPPPWLSYEFEKPVPPYLRPYQVEGLRFLCWRGSNGGLLSDSPGVGKTLQGIGYMDYWRELCEPVLIVVTATTKRQFQRSIKRFYPECDVEILNGKTPYKHKAKNVIINWDILAEWLGHVDEKTKRFMPDGILSSMPWKTIIGDEIQAIGNNSSKRTKAFRNVCKKNKIGPIGMSGTPIKTKPRQFFPLLHLLEPTIFKEEMRFLLRYCGPKNDGFSMTYDGATNMDELHRILRPMMIRRTKEEVLTDLPPKTVEVVPVEIEDIASYRQLELAAFANNGRTKEEVKESVLELKRSAYAFKRKSCVAWIKEKMEELGDGKLIVFAWHKSVVDLLEMDLKEFCPVVVNGSVTGVKRDEAVERFVKNPKCRILVGNILAAGLGLDGLQDACSTVCFAELGAAPTDHLQAEDRVYRSGQMKPVMAYYLIAEDTIDMDMMEVLDSRRKTVDTLLDGKDGCAADFLQSLLKKHLASKT